MREWENINGSSYKNKFTPTWLIVCGISLFQGAMEPNIIDGFWKELENFMISWLIMLMFLFKTMCNQIFCNQRTFIEVRQNFFLLPRALHKQPKATCSIVMVLVFIFPLSRPWEDFFNNWPWIKCLEGGEKEMLL